ncbi:MAG: gerKC4 [Bacillales bacterium]|jgi:spore germination protein KC|nr:gerKC4 [Bacillales bacterium]
MKKVIILLNIVFISISLAGCKPFLKGRTEIDDLTFIKVIAFDKPKKGNIRVTASAKNVSLQTGGSGSSQPSKSINITADGKTVFDAIRRLNLFSEKKPFFGHTEYILISEQMAKHGLLECIDFISRDHELRLNSRIYIVKGMTAQDFLEKSGKGEYFISDRLSHLEVASDTLSLSTKVPLAEAMFILDKPYLSLYIPSVEMKKSLQKSEKGKMDIYLDGFAIFNGDKFIKFLNHNEVRGLTWLRNLNEGGIIVVKDKKGENISLEIMASRTKIEPLIMKNDKLKATITIDITTNLDEIFGHKDIFNKSDLEFIEKAQNETVKKMVMGAIQEAQKTEQDFIGIGSHFYQKHPTVWEKYEKDWGKRLSKIDFVVRVDSNIMRTYQLNEPTRNGGN